MILVALAWVAAIVGIGSAYAIARKWAAGMCGFLVSDALLVVVNAAMHLWPLVALYVVYMGMSVFGLREWTRPKKLGAGRANDAP